MLSYEILPREVQEMLASGGSKKLILVDVREPWEYEEGRIEGSVLIPLGDLPSRAPQELEPESRIVTICHHGSRSLRATMLLREQGFSQAQSLHGGIDAWSVEIDPSIARY